MSFLFEVDLFVASLVIPESTTTSQACKKGKKSSSIWAYTCILLENENLDLFYYYYYKQGSIVKQALYGSKSSSAMTKYINKYHPLIIIKKAMNKKQEVVNQQLRQLYNQAKINGDTTEFNLEILEASFNKPVFFKALITLIVVQNLSFTIVE
jgi:hypothetical protein